MKRQTKAHTQKKWGQKICSFDHILFVVMLFLCVHKQQSDLVLFSFGIKNFSSHSFIAIGGRAANNEHKMLKQKWMS